MQGNRWHVLTEFAFRRSSIMDAKLSWFLVLGVLVVSASGVNAQAYRFA